MITVPVDLGERRYEVLVGDGSCYELARIVGGPPRRSVRRAVVVTQRALERAGWIGSIDPGVPFEVSFVPDGEDAKSMQTIERLCSHFSRAGLARSDVVVAVGGGVVSDVAGFAAAVYHRGMTYVNVATTLLAQVDAAVGGKTGVNLQEGKNLVGAFWQPSAVLCDTAMLSTLPPREWSCGRGEMAKYAFLAGERPAASLLELSLEEQVARCVAIKAAVVASDERERGGRMTLNYGHTLAHALEAAVFGSEEGRIAHGEAVAVGLMFAALLARRLGRIDDDRVDLHRKVISGFGLSYRLPPSSQADELLRLMGRDKKAMHGLTFVLDGPHGVEVVPGVEPGDVLDTLVEMGTAP